jgi:hypothetical protein
VIPTTLFYPNVEEHDSESCQCGFESHGEHMRKIAGDTTSKVSFDTETGELWVGLSWEKYIGEGSCVTLDKHNAEILAKHLLKYSNS